MQVLPARRRDLVGPSAVLTRQRLDQTGILQLRQRAVERARAELDTGELFDVLDQCVPMLRSVGEAGEDQDAAIRRAADRVFRHAITLQLTPISVYRKVY